MKTRKYRGYVIGKHSVWSDYDKCGYNAFMGFSPLLHYPLPTIEKVEIAIRLWIKFHKSPNKFHKYINFLDVDSNNYSGCYGKLITMKQIKEASCLTTK